jgi:hypothetical protein
MVPEEGVEPTHSCEYGILSPARLPVPPLRPESFRITHPALKIEVLPASVIFPARFVLPASVAFPASVYGNLLHGVGQVSHPPTSVIFV